MNKYGVIVHALGEFAKMNMNCLDFTFLHVVVVLLCRSSKAMSSRPNKRHAGASSSSSAPKDKVIFTSSSMRTKFTKCLNKEYLGTRCYDEDTMTDLGIHLEIQRLCERIGAHPLLKLNEPTYIALTAEFLASFKFLIHKGDRSSASLQFQLGNEDRSLSLTQLNNIFGFPAGQEDETVTQEELNEFWFDTTGFQTPFVGALSCYIVHPVFRVIQRLLGNTIGARKEPSKMLEVEHRILFSMVHGKRIDLGYQLALKFARDFKTASVICTGGLITVLAKHFGVALDLYSATPSRLIDMKHLKSIGMVKKDRVHGMLL